MQFGGIICSEVYIQIHHKHRDIKCTHRWIRLSRGKIHSENQKKKKKSQSLRKPII